MTNTTNPTRRTIVAAGIGLTAATITGQMATAGGNDLQANKDIALGLSKAIMNGEWDKAAELIADDFTYEADGRPAIDKASYLGFMRGVLTTSFSDMDMDFLHVIAEGDLVAIDYTNAMTHSGDFLGIPATGKRIIATGQFIREVKDGKVTAEWQTTNAAGMMAQITG